MGTICSLWARAKEDSLRLSLLVSIHASRAWPRLIPRFAMSPESYTAAPEDGRIRSSHRRVGLHRKRAPQRTPQPLTTLRPISQRGSNRLDFIPGGSTLIDIPLHRYYLSLTPTLPP